MATNSKKINVTNVKNALKFVARVLLISLIEVLFFNPVIFGLMVLFAPKFAAELVEYFKKYDHGTAWVINWITIRLQPMKRRRFFLEEHGVSSFSAKEQKKYFYYVLENEGMEAAAKNISYDVADVLWDDFAGCEIGEDEDEVTADEMWDKTVTAELRAQLVKSGAVRCSDEVLTYFINKKNIEMISFIIEKYTPSQKVIMLMVDYLECVAKANLTFAKATGWDHISDIRWYIDALLVVINKFGLSAKTTERLMQISAEYLGVADELLKAGEETAEKQLVADIAYRKAESDWSRFCGRRKALCAKAAIAMQPWMYDRYAGAGMHLDDAAIKGILMSGNKDMILRVFKYERLNEENARIVRSNVTLLKIYSERR